MKFAIRDDDTCFFTNPEDLDKAYGFLRCGCVSLSVVPYTVPIHKDDVMPYGNGIPYNYYDIADNTEIVNYLKRGVEANKYDILLHGYSHEYKRLGDSWKPEMIWKDHQRLQEELSEGKKHLESLFGQTISVFVAPNNAIDQKAISVIENLGMNYSGIIQKNDRRINHKYIWNFISRWGYRLARGIPIPGILDYGKHRELVAYTLDNFDRLIFEYNACKRRQQPFVFYTHYWQVNNSSKTKELLQRITEYIFEDGAELVGLSDCFRS